MYVLTCGEKAAYDFYYREKRVIEVCDVWGAKKFGSERF